MHKDKDGGERVFGYRVILAEGVLQYALRSRVTASSFLTLFMPCDTIKKTRGSVNGKGAF